ncbi:MAG: diaminopimelate decarboxylase [Cyanobacteria bacterium P01_H01_bin.74]
MQNIPFSSPLSAIDSQTDSFSPNVLSRPLTFSIDANNQARIGNLSLEGLAKTYGTPLYVLDQETISASARAYCNSLKEFYPGDSLALYACKANMSMALVKVMEKEGMGLDVVSGGELYTAVNAGFPMDRVLFNGNNKTYDEVLMAVENNINRISADNFHDLALIHQVASTKNKTVDTILRITPGIECHTHDYIKTGQYESKFGFDLSQLPEALALINDQYQSTISLKGLHAHIGSQIFETKPYEDLIEIMMNIYYNIREQYNGLILEDIDLGGGIGICYTGQDDPPKVPDVLKAMTAKLASYSKKLNYPLPRLLLEPGRSMIATAGVTLYTVGSFKALPNHNKKYVAVDGGMGDNIRPALYQANYSAQIANKCGLPIEESITLVGKYCESGDVLINDLPVPQVETGDTVVMFSTGAYGASMASNYNRFPRPASVLVTNGKAHLITARETYDTIIQQDLIPDFLR